ncbi:MAG: O-antigen ligase family protein, partial [Pyrinomonadaceae bacterium]
LYKPRAGVPYGSFVNRNDFAAVMAMLVALPLGMIFTGTVRPEKRLLYLVAAGLMGTSLLLSGSRGGAVALVAEILLLIIISTRARGTKNLALKAALSLLLAASAVGGAVFVGGETSISRFADSAGAEDISSNRTHIWGVTLKVIGEHFPLGAGVGAYAQAYTKSDTASGFERIEQAHNDYLQVLADAGLPGLFIGALFLYWIFRQGRRSIAVENKFRRGVAVGAVAGIFGILVHSLFDFVLHITAISLLFLALMALLTASSRVYDDDVTDLEDERRQRRKASVTPMDRARIN